MAQSQREAQRRHMCLYMWQNPTAFTWRSPEPWANHPELHEDQGRDLPLLLSSEPYLGAPDLDPTDCSASPSRLDTHLKSIIDRAGRVDLSNSLHTPHFQLQKLLNPNPGAPTLTLSCDVIQSACKSCQLWCQNAGVHCSLLLHHILPHADHRISCLDIQRNQTQDPDQFHLPLAFLPPIFTVPPARQSYHFPRIRIHLWAQYETLTTAHKPVVWHRTASPQSRHWLSLDLELTKPFPTSGILPLLFPLPGGAFPLYPCCLTWPAHPSEHCQLRASPNITTSNSHLLANVSAHLLISSLTLLHLQCYSITVSCLSPQTDSKCHHRKCLVRLQQGPAE